MNPDPGLSQRMASDARPIGTAGLIGLLAVGAVLAGGAAVVAMTGDMPHDVALGERQALIVATPIVVGLYAWREGVHVRFGRLLALTGCVWPPAWIAGSQAWRSE
jgi:hypothetical protein